MESNVKVAAAQKRLNLTRPPLRPDPRDRLKGGALGLVSTESFPAIVGAADAMVKAADVFLVGYEKTGRGQCTAIVRGNVADVRMAVEIGVETAEDFGQYVASTVIPRPLPNLEAVLPICAHLDKLRRVGRGRLASQAIGLLETRGFPAMVGAADAMTKAAEVTLMSHETVGDGLCTILVRGSLPNVAIAIEAGMHEAERIGELHAVMVIPRPMGDLEDTLPCVSEAEVEGPLRLPLNLEEKPKERVPLQEIQAVETAKTLEAADSVELPEPVQLPDLERLKTAPEEVEDSLL